MPRVNSAQSAIPNGLIITNKYGQIDLGQIEHGDEIYETVMSLKAQIAEYGLDVDLFRKKSETILEQDLDPSFTNKINNVFDNLDKIITGIDYDGVHYSLSDVMLLFLQNYDRIVSDDYISTVTHI